MGQSNETGKLIGAILLGTAIGAVLGTIFAPDKGSETRKKILAKGDDLTDAIKDKITDLFDEAKKETGTMKDKANSLFEKGAARVDHLELK